MYLKLKLACVIIMLMCTSMIYTIQKFGGVFERSAHQGCIYLT